MLGSPISRSVDRCRVPWWARRGRKIKPFMTALRSVPRKGGGAR
jgi:hypothetical protein